MGLTEEFNLSLELMAYTFGWSSVAQPVHVNVTRNRPRVDELSSEARYRILDANQMDIALYHTARRLFWQRVATMEHPLPAPQTELDALFEAHTRAIHQKINRLKKQIAR